MLDNRPQHDDIIPTLTGPEVESQTCRDELIALKAKAAVKYGTFVRKIILGSTMDVAQYHIFEMNRAQDEKLRNMPNRRPSERSFALTRLIETLKVQYEIGQELIDKVAAIDEKLSHSSSEIEPQDVEDYGLFLEGVGQIFERLQEEKFDEEKFSEAELKS
jgi:hypothetical protein